MEINYEPAQPNIAPSIRRCESSKNDFAQERPSREISRSPYPAYGFGDSTRELDSHIVHDIGHLIIEMTQLPFSVTGGFCDVFKGIHRTAGVVALKRPRVAGEGYDETIIRRFEREAATWRRLKHRHILEFLGTFEWDGHFYLLSQTADAINYLHTEGVLHGDIKASNILINKEGSGLLCDFGLARMTDAITSTLMKGAGSVRWMAPELYDNAPKSPETDIYAFGMTIAE
ncbi:hypothetical protein FS837_003350, partial [Tulasnella sp. UAMH 9824]